MKNKLSYLFIALAILLAISALVILLVRPGEKSSELISVPEYLPVPPSEDLKATKKTSTDLSNKSITDLPNISQESLLKSLQDSLAKNDLEGFYKIIGRDKIDEATKIQIEEFLTRNGNDLVLREVGELKLNEKVRWALESKNSKEESLFLDLHQINGEWAVEKLSLPQNETGSADSLQIADEFLRAVFTQDFDRALVMTSESGVSDAKIAGLCILFEEGQYQLREKKAIRAVRSTPSFSSFLVNLSTADSEKSAQIGLNLEKTENTGEWKIAEVNLDKLLSDFAKRVRGGDIYYSPLVKNPAGGETLALCFEFDEDEINA